MAVLKNTTIDDTGSVYLPFGTSAERPTNPVDGDLRYNTELGYPEFYWKGFWANAETNKGSITSDGLQLFLEAGNPDSYPGTGNTWFDISGNGNNFVWNTTPNTSVDEGIPHFLTDGRIATGPPSNSFGITQQSGCTVLVFCKQISNTEAGAFNWYGNGYTRGLFSHLAWSNNEIYFDYSNGGRVQEPSAGPPYLNGAGTYDWYIWAFRLFSNGPATAISKNGFVIAEDTDNDGGGFSSQPAEVGNTNQYPYTWNARLNAFMLYNRDLSDEEIIRNINAFRVKYPF